MVLMYSDLPDLPNIPELPYVSGTMSLDAKGRVSLPAKIRDWVSKHADGEITANPDKKVGILEVWATRQWHAELKRVINGEQDKDTRRELARKFKNACDLKMDASGRIRISPEMRSLLGLQGKVMVYAAWDHFEICHPDNDPAPMGVTP